jgi:hypothetical protein
VSTKELELYAPPVKLDDWLISVGSDWAREKTPSVVSKVATRIFFKFISFPFLFLWNNGKNDTNRLTVQKNSYIIAYSIIYTKRIDMTIYAMKLITGEDVLAAIDSETETEFVLENPVGIAVVRGQNGQPNVGFAPFPLHAAQVKDATISIAKKHIVYYYEPAEDFITNYNQLFGSGIVLPNKQIITG